jgi:hypothetical protein
MPVSYEKRDRIGIVTLSRPEARNAWGPDFNEGIARHFAAMEDDDEIRCAVLTGDDSGGAFSAGANLKNPKTHTMESPAEFIKTISKRKDRPFEILGDFPQAAHPGRERLRRGNRLHHHLLLRSARRLGGAEWRRRRPRWVSSRLMAARCAWPAGWEGATPCASPLASRSPPRRRTASVWFSGWSLTPR